MSDNDAYEGWPSNDRALVRGAMRLSEPSVRSVWDNDDDAIYDSLIGTVEVRGARLSGETVAEIRSYSESDHASVVAILQVTVPEQDQYAGGCYSVQKPPELLESLRPDSGEWFVATTSCGDVVGVMKFQREYRGGGSLLQEIGVHVSYRRLGIAERLLASAIDMCRAAGHKELLSSTHAGSQPSRRFHEKHGFTLVPEFRDSSLVVYTRVVGPVP